MKNCTNCKTPKEPTEFYFNKSKKNGIDNWCKSCSKEWREDNKDIQKLKKNLWYQNNKQRLKEKRDERNKSKQL